MGLSIAKKQQLMDAIDLMGGDTYVWEMLMEGRRVSEVAAALGVSTGLLLWWINQTEARKAMFEAVRVVTGLLKLEAIEEMLTETPHFTEGGTIDSGWVALQRLRMDAHKWLAGKYYPSLEREASTVKLDVNATIASLIQVVREGSPRLSDVALSNLAAGGKQPLSALPLSQPLVPVGPLPPVEAADMSMEGGDSNADDVNTD